jgi:hypothetical protein
MRLVAVWSNHHRRAEVPANLLIATVVLLERFLQKLQLIVKSVMVAQSSAPV